MTPPAMEVADVMRAYGGEYIGRYGDRMPAIHRKTIGDMTACRTPAMGGTTYYCPDCDRWQYSYYCFGNRNCNKCGNERAQQWLQRTGSLLLPTEHFMVTVTLPGDLRQIARSHQRLFYGLLMQCAAAALQTLGWDTSNSTCSTHPLKDSNCNQRNPVAFAPGLSNTGMELGRLRSMP